MNKNFKLLLTPLLAAALMGGCGNKPTMSQACVGKDGRVVDPDLCPRPDWGDDEKQQYAQSHPGGGYMWYYFNRPHLNAIPGNHISQFGQYSPSPVEPTGSYGASVMAARAGSSYASGHVSVSRGFFGSIGRGFHASS